MQFTAQPVVRPDAKHRMVLGILSIMALAVLLVTAGCGKAPRQQQGMLDTPLHHYEAGMRALDGGNTDAAMRAFNTALELDAEYGPAISGKGLIIAMKGDAEESFDLIRKGQREASRDSDSPERMWTFVHEIRAYIALHDNGIVSESVLAAKSREAYNNARVASNGSVLPDYWQGEAYLNALEFKKARTFFRTVQESGTALGEKASDRLVFLEKVIRASLKTSIGKKIAFVDAISRADMAALLIEELGIEMFFEGTEPVEVSSFVAPEGMAAKGGKAEVIDVQHHPLSADIMAVIKYRLRGLEPYADHSFQPNKPLSRAEVALIMEDIYIRAKNDSSMATRFVGETSPFPDVRSDHPFFNAVMFATTRGLLKADVAKGQFQPMETVSGVDAVLLIDTMKRQLDVF